jgi:hypothetical protein
MRTTHTTVQQQEPVYASDCICLCFCRSHRSWWWCGHPPVAPHQAARKFINLTPPQFLHSSASVFVTAIILGRGAGTHLYPLTKQRAEPFDLTLPCCLFSRTWLYLCCSHHPGWWRGHLPVPPHHNPYLHNVYYTADLTQPCFLLCCDVLLLLSAAAIILGGGAGTRLYPLTKQRAKPAVPIGGAYRLIDVPMSNCINSGISKIYILTQFNSTSLNRHLARTYNMGSGVRFGGEGFVEVLAATQVRHVFDIFATGIIIAKGAVS